MGVPTFDSTEKALKFTIYYYILRLWQKSVLFDDIYPFHCARTAQLINQQSLASTIKKQNYKKMAACKTTVPSSMNTVIGALVYWGITSDLRSRLEQSHQLPGALLPRWLQATYRVSNGHPYLQLYKKGTNILELWKKKLCDIWRNLSLWLQRLFI